MPLKQPIIVYTGRDGPGGPERMALHPGIFGPRQAYRIVTRDVVGLWFPSPWGAGPWHGPHDMTTPEALAWLLEGEQK